MKARTRDALLLILLAVIEVILTETAIRAGLAGVERATSILGILIIFNIALVLGIGASRKQREH